MWRLETLSSYHSSRRRTCWWRLPATRFEKCELNWNESEIIKYSPLCTQYLSIHISLLDSFTYLVNIAQVNLLAVYSRHRAYYIIATIIVVILPVASSAGEQISRQGAKRKCLIKRCKYDIVTSCLNKLQPLTLNIWAETTTTQRGLMGVGTLDSSGRLSCIITVMNK